MLFKSDIVIFKYISSFTDAPKQYIKISLFALVLAGYKLAIGYKNNTLSFVDSRV
jgi:hypothetical protein